MRRLLPLLLLFALIADDARASCALPNPRAQIKYADAAFDGRFVSSRRDGDATWFKFAVDRVFKGQLSAEVEIYQRGVSTIHFGNFEPGERVGLTMNFSDGVWLSNDCQRYDPEELSDAVKPLPRPPGRGRAAYMVSGWFGDAGAVLLDRRARTLAYVYGGPGHRVSVCPGGRRFVQLSGRIKVRRTRDLRVLDSDSAGSTQRVHCLGRVVVRATSSGLFRGDRRIWRGAWRGMAFHGRHAYATVDDVVSRIDLVSGRERVVAQLDSAVGDAAVSPDGRRLAIGAGTGLAVVDIRNGRVRRTDATGYNGIVWTGRDGLALVGHRHFRSRQAPPPARFYDARLRPRGELPGWAGLPAVGVGGAVVGIVGHRVERATAAGASELGRLPSSYVFGVHRLPGVEIRASRRLPRY